MTKNNIKLAIAVPTYNESKNIRKLIRKIRQTVGSLQVNTTVLIIDDNSPDGTGNIAEALKKEEDSASFKIKVLNRADKNGLGKAYIDGFNKLLQEDYTHILQMDADLSHDPKYIKEFVYAIENQDADFIVGSRYIRGGSAPDWSLTRRFLSLFGNIYTRILLGNAIHDYTGGFNLFTKELLKKIDPSSLSQSGGYGFVIELKSRALKNAKKTLEIPIVFMDRQYGKSKMPKNTIIKNFILVLKIRLNLL